MVFCAQTASLIFETDSLSKFILQGAKLHASTDVSGISNEDESCFN